MNKFCFVWLAILLITISAFNELLNSEPRKIDQLQAEEILSEMNFQKMKELIKTDKDTIGEKNINTLYKFSYNILLNAPTAKELDKKLSFHQFVKEKYPHNLSLFEDSRVLNFKIKLITTIMVLILFFYFNVQGKYDVLFLTILFICPFLNLIYLRKLTDVLPFSLLFLMFHFFSLFFPDKRPLFWTRKKNFYGLSFTSSIIYSAIFAFVINLTLFFSKFGLSVSFGEYSNEFFTKSIFYFMFPWLFLAIISSFIIVRSFGIYITDDSVCILGLFNFPSLPLFFSKKDILNLVIERNVLTVNFKNGREPIRIRRFFLKNQLIHVND